MEQILQVVLMHVMELMAGIRELSNGLINGHFS